MLSKQLDNLKIQSNENVHNKMQNLLTNYSVDCGSRCWWTKKKEEIYERKASMEAESSFHNIRSQKIFYSFVDGVTELLAIDGAMR